MKTKEVTLSQDKTLYCIPCGEGFTCLGIERCNNLAVHLARELANRGYSIPMPAAVGTLERYAQYRQFCEWAKRENERTGFRSTAELTPELIGKEGQRVEVVHEWEPGKPETVRFKVGKSTGFIPCHIELKNSRSTGGPAVCLGSIKSVRIV